MNWAEIYADEIKDKGGPVSFVIKKAKEKKVLLDKIIAYSKPERRILEAGCGTGANSIYLASLGYNVDAIDNDVDMLNISGDIAKNFSNRPNFFKMDIFHTYYKDKSFDVVFSHGVLEHFKDDDIMRILSEQLRIGRYVIFSVPSDYFSDKDKMYGDERFMNSDQWKKLLNRTDGNLLDNFGYHYKGILRNITESFPHLLVNRSPYIGFILASKRNL